MKRCRVGSSLWWFSLPVCLIFLPALVFASDESRSASVATTEAKRIQDLVNDLRTRLSVPHEVTVSIVPQNPLMVSVGSVDHRNDAFLLSFDEHFLGTLTEAELEAAIAHELGHVWIFTHHPYLQTEQLANRIAMRVVSRDSLETVYQKVWERDGNKGDLVRFLGK